eukprot:315847-Pyramimonas_sp.AAC.1
MPSFVAAPPPFLGVNCVQQTKIGAVEAADELIQYCKGFEKHHTNLLKTLDSQMDHLCRLCRDPAENKKDSSDEEGDDVRESPCWRAG